MQVRLCYSPHHQHKLCTVVALAIVASVVNNCVAERAFTPLCGQSLCYRSTKSIPDPFSGVVVQMLLSPRVDYPYPLMITFWGRLSGLLLVLCHFMLHCQSLRKFAHESKQVVFSALRLALLFAGATCAFHYGLRFSSLADAMILSAGCCPVYIMLLSK